LVDQTSLWWGLINNIEKTRVFRGKLRDRNLSTSILMSSSSELFSVQNIPSDLVERQNELPSFLRRSLHMLDLQPEVEMAKYRHYKEGKIDTYAKLSPVVTTPDLDEEDYEIIPPSEPFAILERSPDPADSTYARSERNRQDPPGGLVFQEPAAPAASLDLSSLPPGEISSARNEYLPASEELWRSLGKPTSLTTLAPVRPRWQLPVAIGSTACAIVAVSGMTYVNMNPALLQQVPLVAQITAPVPLPAVPPGQSLQGPDLAMGEFSDLSLGNINSIAAPASNVAQAPVTPAPNTNPVTTPVTVPNTTTSPIIAGAVSPNPVNSPVAAPSEPVNEKLATALRKYLLPPNIQQMAGQTLQSPAPAAQQSVSPVIKPTTGVQPYTPKQMYFQPTDATRYQVMTKYINPIGFDQVKIMLPQATIEGDRINLGVYRKQADANQIVKKLQQKGIQAWLK
jgi:hypothetical protein